MPIKRCKLKNNKTGWKWGNSGKCYPSKSKANKQARAAYASGYKQKSK